MQSRQVWLVKELGILEALGEFLKDIRTVFRSRVSLL